MGLKPSIKKVFRSKAACAIRAASLLTNLFVSYMDAKDSVNCPNESIITAIRNQRIIHDMIAEILFSI